MTTLDGSDPAELAAAWLAADPDADTRAETERLLAEGGDELVDRFGNHLEFGTAGLRGRLGAGPNRMNRVLVRLTAAAIADEILADPDETDPHVVIGYDARHGSAEFAHDTARVLLARGIRCTILPGPLPTPVLAFTVRNLDASAGVMVTASHNPRDDNGYKVYWRGGALITAPLDGRIAERMRSTPLLGEADLAPAADPGLTTGSGALVAEYVDAVVTAALAPTSARTARTVHTALHGVGTATLQAAFAAAGFASPVSVPEQAEPDPDFPTAAFPNPEEPGSLDLLLDLGDREQADLALANDPDADRLAVAVPTPAGWHSLSGDDLGCVLADHLLRREAADDRPALVVNTVVSSRLLGRIAAHHGATHVETLTGFKWIMDAVAARPDHRFVCGYEEALGYAVTDAVPDKDGISAALAITELAGELKAEGRTVLDRIDELHRTHGVHVNGQRAVRFETRSDGASAQKLAMAHLRAQPPTAIDGAPVRAVADLAEGATGLPPTDGLVIDLDDARLVIRPSGTEPKLKVYGEVRADAGEDVSADRREARTRLRQLLHATVALTTGFDLAPFRADDVSARPAASEPDPPPRSPRERVDLLQLIVRCLDLTTLEGDDTAARVRALCAQARRPAVSDPSVGPVAAVCVYPALVPTVAEILGGTGINTASVAGAFPSGLSGPAVVVADIEDAVARGADEIDIVIDRPALLEGRIDDVVAALDAARAATEGRHLKVILEVGELDDDQITVASHLAMEAGADFIKTSTGKTKQNATAAAARIMAEAIRSFAETSGRRVGLKVAGGVRTADDALVYVDLVHEILGDEWLTPDLLRFGASSLLDALVAELDQG